MKKWRSWKLKWYPGWHKSKNRRAYAQVKAHFMLLWCLFERRGQEWWRYSNLARWHSQSSNRNNTKISQMSQIVLFINRQVAWGMSYKIINATPADQDIKASLRQKWKARKSSELFQSLRYKRGQSRKLKINPQYRKELRSKKINRQIRRRSRTLRSIQTKLWSSQLEQK